MLVRPLVGAKIGSLLPVALSACSIIQPAIGFSTSGVIGGGSGRGTGAGKRAGACDNVDEKAGLIGVGCLARLGVAIGDKRRSASTRLRFIGSKVTLGKKRAGALTLKHCVV